MDLQRYREQIDKIDAELMRLFSERMEVAKKIAAYKKENGIPIFDPKREKEKLSAIDDPYSKKLCSVLFELSRESQSEIVRSGGGNKKLIVINGPNLNMLGVREPELYGNKSYADLTAFVREACDGYGAECECVQSNHEGGIIDVIQSARGKCDGIIINPAAYTHTSIAIYDALKATGIRAVEVHLTDISKREEFRRVSYVSAACEKTFAGLGFEGYAEAVRWLLTNPVL